jgi:adenylate kinase family enzyme
MVMVNTKFGCNPALERGVSYTRLAMHSQGGKVQWLNINYILHHPDYETAYRCDVTKYENAGKLNVESPERSAREDEVVTGQTPYKEAKRIMLAAKFAGLSENYTTGEAEMQNEYAKEAERERLRQRETRNPEPAANLVGVVETYEEQMKGLTKTHPIRAAKGPCYKLVSKEGLREDDFATCPQQDLLDYARTEALRVLLLGAPRAGKTALAGLLCKRLDLVHVSVENWLIRLQDKVKNYEPPEEEPEEGQTVPDFLTPLERAVEDALKAGSGPTHEHTLEILKEECASPLAQTKGYVLDLTFCKANDPWAKSLRNHNIIGAPDSNGNSASFTHVIELDLSDDEIRERAAHMRLDPADGVVYSRWEITERNKPKPKKYDEDGNEIEEEEDPEDENAVKPLDLTTLVQRVEDTPDFVQRELANYKSQKKDMDYYINGGNSEMGGLLFHHQYIKLDVAGLTPEAQSDRAAEASSKAARGSRRLQGAPD